MAVGHQTASEDEVLLREGWKGRKKILSTAFHFCDSFFLPRSVLQDLVSWKPSDIFVCCGGNHLLLLPTRLDRAERRKTFSTMPSSSSSSSILSGSNIAKFLALAFGCVFLLQLSTMYSFLHRPAIAVVHLSSKYDGHTYDEPGGFDNKEEGAVAGQTKANEYQQLQHHLADVVIQQQTQAKLRKAMHNNLQQAKEQVDDLRSEAENVKLKLAQARDSQRRNVARDSDIPNVHNNDNNNNNNNNNWQKEVGRGSGANVIPGVNDGSSVYSPTVAQRSLGLDSPLLVLCYSRDDYLTKTLETVLKYHPTVSSGAAAVPIVVSQDGNIEKVNRAIEKLRAKFLQKGIPFAWIKHPKATKAKNGYEKLAQHFGCVMCVVVRCGALCGPI